MSVVSSQIWIAAVLVGLTGYLAYKLISGLRSPLARLPGTWHSLFTELGYTLDMARGESWRTLTALHRRYGPLVRVGPNAVSVAGAADVHTVLDSHTYRKGAFYHPLRFRSEQNLVTISDPVLYKQRRRWLAPGLSNRSLQAMEPAVQEILTDHLSTAIQRHHTHDQPVELMQLITLATMDVITRVCMGTSVGLLNDSGHPIVDWAVGTTRLTFGKFILGNQLASVLLPTYQQAEDNLIAFARNAVEERRRRCKEGKPPAQDLLQILIEDMEEKTGDSLPLSTLAGELVMLLLAGTDTTALTVMWTIITLLQRPDCLDRLMGELTTALPSPTDPVPYKAVQSLPYLNALLYEVLRHTPATGVGVTRVSPPEGGSLSGHYIPPGTEIKLITHPIQRNPQTFDRPDLFDPDRWLASAEEVTEMKRNLVIFSMGPRVCLGRSLAWMEMRIAVATIVRRFHLELVPEQRLEPTLNFLMKPRDNQVLIRMRPRVD